MLLPKLEDNTWSTLAIESVLIVLSVVLGFAVTEWRQARENTALAQSAKQNVLSEIERNRAQVAEAQAQGNIGALEGTGRSFTEGINLGFSLLGAGRTIKDAVGQYRDPGRQTAETAAKRLAKAKRKRDRREKDMSLLEGYLYRPFRDASEAQTAVDEGEKEDEFEVAFAPGG
jgi:hypothetical protein